MPGSTEEASLERPTTLAHRHEERQQLRVWNENMRYRDSLEREEVSNISFNVDSPV